MDAPTRVCVVCGRQYSPAPTGRPSVTCSPECRRQRTSVISQRAKRRAAVRGCPDDKHGTASGYGFYKCGCDACSRWARLYQQERRRKRRKQHQ